MKKNTPLLKLNPGRYFSSNPQQRKTAKYLYEKVKNLPLICPHGHVNPKLFADNKPFPDPTELLVIPDHYLFRMLYSQGIPMESLGVPRIDGGRVEADHRKIWKIIAQNFYLFRGTPTGLWLKHEMHDVFGIKKRLMDETAMEIYDQISDALSNKDNLPRAMFEKFNIEVLSTTDFPTDTLESHQQIRDSGWKSKIVPAFRPDNCTDLLYRNWKENIKILSELTGLDCMDYQKYIRALEERRAFFKKMGTTSSDHGVLSSFTVDLSQKEAEKLFNKGLKGKAGPEDAKLFTGHMLMEMARMSTEDNLVMQIHAGAVRNHNSEVFLKFGFDKGCDIPQAVDFVHDLRPLLNKFGNNTQLTVICFTIDETTYARELAPLAGHYPAMKLGPAWWFNDSLEGMLRFRRMTTETAGIYNTVGFNDDTRAFPSIPARHDLARRVDARYLAELVSTHVIELDEALEMIVDLAYGLPKKNYRF